MVENLTPENSPKIYFTCPKCTETKRIFELEGTHCCGMTVKDINWQEVFGG